MDKYAAAGEDHFYRIKILADPHDVPVIIVSIEALLRSKGYPTAIEPYDASNWLCLSEKPLDPLLPQINRISGVNEITELEPSTAVS
jgi:hypothetical protein